MKDDTRTRRQVATLLSVHQDSVTRLLPEGLGSAVTNWGGSGKAMQFSLGMVLRWHSARNCPRLRNGGYCWHCRSVLEDAKCVAEHLLAARHGGLDYFDKCPYDGEECGYPGPISEPCVPPLELGALNDQRSKKPRPHKRPSTTKERSRTT